MIDFDYFVSETARSQLDSLSSSDIEACFEDMDSPDGLIIVTDNFSAVYVMTPADFSKEAKWTASDPFMTIEYFENGIPSWLNPLPVPIYFAVWNGSPWDYARIATK